MENSKTVKFLEGVLVGIAVGLFLASNAISKTEEDKPKQSKPKTVEQLKAENRALKLILESYER